MKKLLIKKEYLEEKYINQGLSSFKIAEELNCNYMTILNKMKEFGIPTRKDGIKHPNITKEFLEKEYFENKKGLQVIAKEIGCSFSALRRRMKKYNLLARPKDVLINISGEKFGNWTILERVGDKWKCRCDCGKEFKIIRNNLISGNSKCCRYCSSKKNSGSLHTSWKGYKGISGTIWSYVKQSAKKRSIELTISIEDIWNLYIFQNKKCALSGLDIYISETNTQHLAGLTTASLDRIDSNFGYVKNNIQWLHKDINKIKSDLNEKYFVELCKLISNHKTI